MAGKADIVDCVANSVEGITKGQAGDAVDAVFECITGFLAEAGPSGSGVSVPGFGVYKAERTGRNPQTGEKIIIKAHNAVRFRPAKALKDAVNE